MKIIKMVLLVTIGLVLSACGDRLVFVTKTSFGVDLGMGSGVENGMHIGFKRIEGVIDPIKCDKLFLEKEIVHEHCYAQSVLAKLNFGVDSDKSENNDPKANIAQWFATGEAATILAGNKAVAIALTGKDIKLANNFTKGLSSSELAIMKNIYSKSNKLNENNDIDSISKGILDEFANMGEEIEIKNTNSTATIAVDNMIQKGFSGLIQFYDYCNTSDVRCVFKESKTFKQFSMAIDNRLANLLAKMAKKTLFKQGE